MVLKKEKAEKRQDLPRYFILLRGFRRTAVVALSIEDVKPTMSGKQQDAKLDMALCTSPSVPFYAHICEEVD